MTRPLCIKQNRGTFSQHNTHWKSCHSLRLLAPNELDLSMKLYSFVGLEAAKIQEIKLEVEKKIVDSVRFDTNAPRPGWTCRFFYPQVWTLIFLQPFALQECIVPHSKDLIHIYFEQEAQGCGMTFNVCYIGSKYPNFISYWGVLSKQKWWALCK